jgi:hypothetical protein
VPPILLLRGLSRRVQVNSRLREVTSTAPSTNNVSGCQALQWSISMRLFRLRRSGITGINVYVRESATDSDGLGTGPYG